MAEYITSTDVQSRLTPIGLAWVADRDSSGTGVTAEEESLYVDPAIAYAGVIVDQHIAGRTSPTRARAAGNQWLKDRCLDLAVFYALETGGAQAPDSFKERADQSLKWLVQHQAGEISIPDYVYEYPIQRGSRQSTRGPRVHNVRKGL